MIFNIYDIKPQLNLPITLKKLLILYADRFISLKILKKTNFFIPVAKLQNFKSLSSGLFS